MDLPESVKVWSQFFHPAFMWILFGVAVYALVSGIKSKKARTAEDTALKKEYNPKKEKHHLIGSILLSLVVLGNLGGMAATYINNGKLFVGPHLLVGLGMLAIVATSAALVPAMKTSNIARNAHISLNLVLLGLFSWQALTGMQILFKIIGSLGGSDAA
ncbi:hypothetical protein PCC7418_2445 [Halothece sp. PCC 7418]|uniref:DUF4079 domain-containing protein n=1 Tax=Halothece sp. (strain PCC 7418) TaxID=65093 RepID=UPI0002A07477|nr:DUF4079 domain-containing protein [Halothece sp. PCC 7418]AFZ44592.1 hypothetical protein PCC7418_2445 [Halothece sp. PCC 7418]